MAKKRKKSVTTKNTQRRRNQFGENVSFNDDSIFDRYQELLKSTIQNRNINIYYSKNELSNEQRNKVLDLLPHIKHLPKGSTEVKGSAMCPYFASINHYWNIGSMGSVWSDVRMPFGDFRIGFYPKDDCSFSIQKMN